MAVGLIVLKGHVRSAIASIHSCIALLEHAVRCITETGHRVDKRAKMVAVSKTCKAGIARIRQLNASPHATDGGKQMSVAHSLAQPVRNVTLLAQKKKMKSLSATPNVLPTRCCHRSIFEEHCAHVKRCLPFVCKESIPLPRELMCCICFDGMLP